MEKLDEKTPEELLKLMNRKDKTVPEMVEEQIPFIKSVIDQTVNTIKNGGRVYYMGAGTSGRLGILDASECPPTFGVEPDLFTALIAGGDEAIQVAVEDAEDDTYRGKQETLEKLTKKDILIAISASGNTPYVLGGIEGAKENGAATACVVCAENSRIEQEVVTPIVIPVGEEMVQGSSRLKAGTAQKLVLNMISTVSMIQLGKVYDNYMVDVKATNQKLRERVLQILMKITNETEENSRQALIDMEGDLKVAVLHLLFATDYETGKKYLNCYQGDLREAIYFLQEVSVSEREME